MADERVIAKLIGKLVFQADNRPLMAFEKRLDAVNQKMQQVVGLANKRVSMKLGIDMRGFAQKLNIAERTKIKLSNIDVDNLALEVAEAKIERLLATSKVVIKDIKIPIADLRAQKQLMRSFLESTTIDLPVDVRVRQAEKTLREWRKALQSRFKLTLEADISRYKLLRNVKESLLYVTGKVGTIKLATPQIKLSVDRVALRAEIQSVLRQIEREAKIRIDLRGHVSGSGGGGAGVGRVGRPTGGAMTSGAVAGSVAGLGRGFIPGLGAGFAAMNLNRINQEIQAQKLAMTAVMGGVVGPEGDAVAAGEEQQKWMRNLADTIGLDYRATQPAYTKMLASGSTSGFEVEEVQNIFTGVSAYGRTMGLDSEAMKGTMRAVEQMMNKGQIMSEELKGQLAERAPGVISAMAEAAGFTGEDAAQKLFKGMEDGEIMAKDVLEKFSAILLERSKQGGALEKAMQSTAAQQARFQNAFTDAVEAFAEGGFDRGVAGFFVNLADAMERAEPLTRALGGAFEYIMLPIDAAITLIGDLGEALPDLAKKLGMSEKSLAAFGVVALLNITPIGRIVTAISLGVLALEDFITYLKGGESQFGKFMESLSPENQAALKDLGNNALKYAENVGKMFSAMGSAVEKLFDFIDKNSDGGAFGLFIGVLDSVIAKLALMVDLITKIASGDFAGAAKVMGDVVMGKLNAGGKVIIGALDAVLPGTPGSDAHKDIVDFHTPSPMRPEKVVQDNIQKQRYQALGMIPTNQADQSTKIEKIQIDVHGVTDPQQVAIQINKVLQEKLQQAKVGLGEGRK